MMQINGEFSSHRHSLLNVMNRFIAAANNMDETIMVPSLLRDVPLEGQGPLEDQGPTDDGNHGDEPGYQGKQRDMYDHYLLLKSIKNDMEWGLFKRELGGASSFLEMTVRQEEARQPRAEGVDASEGTSDLEGQFHYHLRGLFGVLSKLTLQADHLTNRYKREIGGGDLMR